MLTFLHLNGLIISSFINLLAPRPSQKYTEYCRSRKHFLLQNKLNDLFILQFSLWKFPEDF